MSGYALTPTEGNEDMDGYYDVSVIVEGALDDDRVFGGLGGSLDDGPSLEEYVAQVSRKAEADGLETEVYVRYHGHELEIEECSCAQYETDHFPKYHWNAR